MAELPTYVIRPELKRTVVSQFITGIVLSILFYAGILLNITLLGLTIPTNVNLLIIITLFLLTIAQSLLTYVQVAKIQYTIYQNRIQIESPQPQYILYSSIMDIKAKKNFWDNIFGTGTIVLEPGLKLLAVPNFDQNFQYVKQMVQYAKSQYNQM